jgi:hypothetical protein|uniref:YqaJ viral recombinase domain-containing protein n=1 Tax=viral metagenome TaxID=1070528 RepID=A0A6C0BKE4_9ZZZZ
MTLLRKYHKYVGPSQFGAILGLDEFQSCDDLRDEIENGYIPISNTKTQYGNDYESIALYYYQKIHHVTIEHPKFAVDPHNPRIGGICDGLLDVRTGIEVKCHTKESNLLQSIHPRYLVQLAGYLYLYQRDKWILISNIFNSNQTLKKCQTFEVTWDQVKSQWEQEWYPKIVEFVTSVKWAKDSSNKI